MANGAGPYAHIQSEKANEEGAGRVMSQRPPLIADIRVSLTCVHVVDGKPAGPVTTENVCETAGVGWVVQAASVYVVITRLAKLSLIMPEP